MRPEFLEHCGVVLEASGEPAEDVGEQPVAIVGTAALHDRRRTESAIGAAEVDADADHHTRHRPVDEFREHARELARSRTVEHDQVVRPFCQHRRIAALVDRRSGRGGERPDRGRGPVGRHRHAQADEQRVTRHVLPPTAQTPLPGGLVVGHQHRTRPVAGTRRRGEILVGRARRRDVIQRSGPEFSGHPRAQGQKAGRGCRIGGVHSTNH